MIDDRNTGHFSIRYIISQFLYTVYTVDICFYGLTNLLIVFCNFLEGS